MRITLPAALALTLLATDQDLPVPTLVNTTDLSESPGGRRLGVLLSGAPVRVLETDGAWVRVSVDGWIAADDVRNAAAAGDAGAPALPGRVSGSVYVTGDDGSTTVGSAVAVRLLGDPVGFTAFLGSVLSECDVRRDALASEIAALKEEGDNAMRLLQDTTAAFEKYDEAKNRRRQVEKDLLAHQRECAARVEKAVEERTLARTITSSDGRYEIPLVEPGSYILHVALDSEEDRHVWDVQIALGSGESLTADLTAHNRTRLERIYR